MVTRALRDDSPTIYERGLYASFAACIRCKFFHLLNGGIAFESRRKAYYLMAIHENLTKVPKQRLKAMGWSKAVEMVKVARREGENFDCATWLHKAEELPKEEFKREVEKHLTGKESEPWELIYFKVYRSQLPVIEQALETAALMLGSDKSRGYTLEMICADFLAGANLEKQNQDR